MKTRLVAPILMLILLAGCGGGRPIGSSQSAPTAGPGSTSKPAGAVDCAAITAAAAQLIGVQLLAQLNSPESVEAIKSKSIGNLDIEAFLSAMDDLHALDGYASPLGDPKAAIDTYEKAAAAAKVLFATEPVTQAAIDTYKANVGDVSTFLGHQVAISGAIDEAGC